MARWFRLYETVVDDPKVQRLSDTLFRAWINLLCVASRADGVIPDDLRELSFRLRKPPVRVRGLLEELSQAALLDRVAQGYQPHDWDAHQYKSDASRERVQRHRGRISNDDVTADVTGPETETETEQSRTEKLSSLFDDFWKACPRKVGKGAAEKSFARALKLAAPEVLMTGIKAYAALVAERDPTFICHPATWLNQQRWLDEGVTPPAPDAEGEAAARALWGGAAGALVDAIGAASFQAYFAEAAFEAGPPVRISFAKPHLHDLARRKYGGVLARLYGPAQLTVRA